MHYEASQAWAKARDLEDPLASLRQEFYIPKMEDGKEKVYFCGHSLGLQPKSTSAAVELELKKWQDKGVDGHKSGSFPWVSYHECLLSPLAKLVGAKDEEVGVMNSLTTNLHLLMVSFFRPTKHRYKILIEAQAFPSDRYAVESQLKMHGLDPAKALLIWQPRPNEGLLRLQDGLDLIAGHGEEIALVLLPGVQYLSGQVLGMEMLTAAAQAKGCMVGLDLAHAIGNIPLQLHAWQVDFAVWCHYKYLNSGPGAVGGYYIHQKHHNDPNLPRFCGWWGHDKQSRFRMPQDFVPIPTAEAWQLSNPPILALAAIRASLDVFAKVGGMQPLRQKSKLLTGYLAYLLQEEFGPYVEMITPNAVEERGCQLSLKILSLKENSPEQDGQNFLAILNTHGIVVDWREPHILRVAPTPLYNSFDDIWRCVQQMKASLQNAH